MDLMLTVSIQLGISHALAILDMKIMFQTQVAVTLMSAPPIMEIAEMWLARFVPTIMVTANALALLDLLASIQVIILSSMIDIRWIPFLGVGCSDIDECADGTAICGASTLCVNTPGSYTCTSCSGASFCPTITNSYCYQTTQNADLTWNYVCRCNNGYVRNIHGSNTCGSNPCGSYC